MLPGWAFRYGDSAIPDKLLKGRTARVIATMDSPNWWYRLIHRRAAHRAFVTGTLKFVGISPVQETTIYANRELSESQRRTWLERIKDIAIKDLKKQRRRSRYQKEQLVS